MPAWHPHKLSSLDADILCAELIEGGITKECSPPAGKHDVALFLIPGRQRTEASGTLVSFEHGGSFEQWIAESIAGDAGVAPVYHYAHGAKMIVSFSGDVPEATKLQVAEALDAL